MLRLETCERPYPGRRRFEDDLACIREYEEVEVNEDPPNALLEVADRRRPYPDDCKAEEIEDVELLDSMEEVEDVIASDLLLAITDALLALLAGGGGVSVAAFLNLSLSFAAELRGNRLGRHAVSFGAGLGLRCDMGEGDWDRTVRTGWGRTTAIAFLSVLHGEVALTEDVGTRSLRNYEWVGVLSFSPTRPVWTLFPLPLPLHYPSLLLCFWCSVSLSLIPFLSAFFSPSTNLLLLSLSDRRANPNKSRISITRQPPTLLPISIPQINEFLTWLTMALVIAFGSAVFSCSFTQFSILRRTSSSSGRRSFAFIFGRNLIARILRKDYSEREYHKRDWPNVWNRISCESESVIEKVPNKDPFAEHSQDYFRCVDVSYPPVATHMGWKLWKVPLEWWGMKF